MNFLPMLKVDSLDFGGATGIALLGYVVMPEVWVRQIRNLRSSWPILEAVRLSLFMLQEMS